MIQLTHRITFLSIKLTCHIYRRLGNTPLSLSLPVSLPLLLSLSILFTLSLSFYLSFFLFFLSILTKREIREKRESECCVTSNSVELIVHECRLLLKTQTIIWKQNILVSFLHSHILYFLEEIKTSLQRTLPAQIFLFLVFSFSIHNNKNSIEWQDQWWSETLSNVNIQQQRNNRKK